MEWHSWLSESSLDPVLVREYAFLFASNELGEGDIAHLDHEFLRSMGISVAKHRLEILKLARNHTSSQPFAGILAAAVRRAGRSIARYVKALALRRREGDDSAIVVVKPPGETQAGKWKKKKAKITKKLVVNVRRGPLLLTDGGGRKMQAASPAIKALSGGRGGENIKWDSLFQDLKPT